MIILLSFNRKCLEQEVETVKDCMLAVIDEVVLGETNVLEHMLDTLFMAEV